MFCTSEEPIPDIKLSVYSISSSNVSEEAEAYPHLDNSSDISVQAYRRGHGSSRANRWEEHRPQPDQREGCLMNNNGGYEAIQVL